MCYALLLLRLPLIIISISNRLLAIGGKTRHTHTTLIGLIIIRVKGTVDYRLQVNVICVVCFKFV